MPCFPRHLSDDFLRLLVPDGPLNFLITGCARSAIPDHYAVDVQLRAGNTIQYYHGTTSLLRITFDGTRLQADAARKYRRLPGFHELFTSCSLEPSVLTEYQRILPSYLAAAVSAADPRYYGDGTVGCWQNRLSIFCGRDWRPGLDWLVIDREAGIEFESRAARQELLGPNRARLLATCRQFDGEPQSTPGAPATADTLGYAPDFLALGPDGELVCVELVDESNARSTHLSPLRACACRDDFRLVLDHIAGDLDRLVRQKALLGLLPSEAVNRLPATGIRRVDCAAVMVAEDGERASWDRLRGTMTFQGETRMSIFQLWSDEAVA